MAYQRIPVAPWRLILAPWRLSMAPWRLTLAPRGLTAAPWGLTPSAPLYPSTALYPPPPTALCLFYSPLSSLRLFIHLLYDPLSPLRSSVPSAVLCPLYSPPPLWHFVPSMVLFYRLFGPQSLLRPSVLSAALCHLYGPLPPLWPSIPLRPSTPSLCPSPPLPPSHVSTNGPFHEIAKQEKQTLFLAKCIPRNISRNRCVKIPKCTNTVA